ncbi:MAG: MFS transporter [Anaerolineae bacterium]
MPVILWINTRLRLALRHILQIDQPVVWRSNEEIAAEAERNYPWNFSVNLIEGASFFFGSSFISSSTIVPLFISKLTPSPLPIGLASVIAQAGWFLPQLFTANVVERLPRKKPVVVNLGFFLERLPVWMLVGAAWLAGRSPSLALGLFLLSYAWHNLGAGLVATAWQDLIARCFPVDRRGRFLGTTLFVGTGTGMMGAALSTRILGHATFPLNFAYIFAIAALGITVSWFFIALTREPVQPITTPRQSSRQFWAGLLHILRQDHNFRRFLVARLTLALGYMGAGFITVAAVQRWGVPDSLVGIYTGALLLGQTIGNLFFGFLADRYGHKLSLELSALAAFLAFSIAWLAPTAEWYYAVFVLLGITLGAIIVSGILVAMEFCEPQRRPTYAGMANTGVGVISVAAPLLGAWLASVSYDWLFALSAGVNLLALALMRWWVREPRQVGMKTVPVER